MAEERREGLADWLILAGAATLFASLFFTWSHQFSRTFLAEWGTSGQLTGVPRDPTAWQVYSVADVLLALLAASLTAVALRGTRSPRLWTLLATAGASAFIIHALGKPPTDGANIFDPSLRVPRYVPNSPTAGAGETVALVALAVAAAGLLLSLTVPQQAGPPR